MSGTHLMCMSLAKLMLKTLQMNKIEGLILKYNIKFLNCHHLCLGNNFAMQQNYGCFSYACNVVHQPYLAYSIAHKV